MRAALRYMLLLMVGTSLTCWAQTRAAKPAGSPTPKAEAKSTDAAQAAQPQESEAERQQRMAEARADIQKMRNLLDAMDRNVAFAAPGETPLKHQFELEIDLWRALLDHMEQEVSPAKAPKQ